MSPFQRLLSIRSLFRGVGLAALCWSFLGALLSTTIILQLFLLIDLLATGGDVNIPGADLRAIAADNADPLRRGTPDELEDDQIYTLHDQGLLATALRFRSQLFGRPLAALCSRIPLLRDNSAAAILLILVLAAAGILRAFVMWRAQAAGIRLGMQSGAQLRQSLHRQALRLTPGDLDGSAVRSSLELFSHNVDRVAEELGRWASRVPGELLLLVLMLLLAIAADVRLALQCIVPVAIAWGMTHFQRQRSEQIRSLAASRAETSLRTLGEGLGKARLVRGYGMEDFELRQFQKHLERHTRDAIHGRTHESWAVWTARGCVVLCAALVVFFITAHVLNESNPVPLSAGALLVLALLRGVRSVELLNEAAAARHDVNVQGDRIYRYLAEIPEVGQAVGAKFLQPVAKSIILESVTYRANGAELLKNCDLRIPARSSTAIISLDPGVRRAAAYLLPRFIEPQVGRVLFDSEDTAWATLESLRAETIYVGGADPFFTGTVAENLTCGDSRFSLQEATEAAKLAHAHSFIQHLPQGYETLIGEHGERLDAGQAFRLGLARAILRKPAVMIIEEPADSLDDDTKALLDDAYNRITRDRTVIFLPTRLSTVRRCDQIALLHEGRVAAIGSHDVLVKQSELYRHWEYVNFKAPQSIERATAAKA
jgi:ABC-type multidrug transport system fused ATPase/permease subunit